MIQATLLASFSFYACALDAITLQQRQGGNRVFVDAGGRERVFHGTNAVVKGPPWVPDWRSFSADISMSKEDFEWMQKLGLNALRLGVFWTGVEPVRGYYNESYLDELEHIVNLAASHGVYTFLDMHQDGFAEQFCGEGFPPWAVRRSEFREELGWPFPYSKPLNDSQLYNEGRLAGSPRVPTHWACGAAKHGPGWGEGTKENSQAWQALYSNWEGIGDAFAAMWAKVASRFAHRPEILGLELINEPFAGDFYADPLIMVPFPNPGNADAKNLQPLYDKVNTAVRAVDKNVLLFVAGTTWDDFGVGFTAPPGGEDYANRTVIAYHYYHPPQVSVDLQFKAYQIAAHRLQTAAFMTESDHAPGREIVAGDVGDGADAVLQSWTSWEWKSFVRGGNYSNPSQFAAYGSGKTGHGYEWPGPVPNAYFQKGFARTYAVAIAGKAESMFFNVTSYDFDLRYVVQNGDPGIATEIYLWPERYPGGATVETSASTGSMRIDYNGSGRHVFVYPSTGVHEGTEVVVKIRTKAASFVV